MPLPGAPPAWSTSPPDNWERYKENCDALTRSYDLRKLADRQQLAKDVGTEVVDGDPDSGSARQIMQGAQQQVWLYERDLCLGAAMHQAAITLATERADVKGSTLGSADRCVVGIVGLAHVPGIVGNWCV